LVAGKRGLRDYFCAVMVGRPEDAGVASHRKFAANAHRGVAANRAMSDPSLGEAYALHQAGRFVEAADVYRKILLPPITGPVCRNFVSYCINLYRAFLCRIFTYVPHFAR
jgi:hypothetical protein